MIQHIQTFMLAARYSYLSPPTKTPHTYFWEGGAFVQGTYGRGAFGWGLKGVNPALVFAENLRTLVCFFRILRIYVNKYIPNKQLATGGTDTQNPSLGYPQYQIAM